MKTLRWLTVACLVPCWALIPACKSPTESTRPTQANTEKAEKTELDAAQTRIHGALLGHDGEPIPLAQIHVTLSEHEPFEVPVAADGSFELELPGPGWATLRLTGVSHAEHSLGFLSSGGEHEITVRLGTYARPETVTELHGFGRFDGANAQVNLAFEKRDDGTWVSKVERDEAGADAKGFHYQIANATSVGRTMNGTQADRYEYDGGGDYLSVVTLAEGAEGDSFELVYDPGAMPPAGAAIALDHGDPESSLARSLRLGMTLEGWRTELEDAARSGPPEQLQAALTDARDSLRARIEAAAETEDDPVSKRMLLVAWAATLPRDPDPEHAEHGKRVAQVEQALTVLGPRDPVWAMDEWAIVNALAYVDDRQYFSIAANEHPEPSVSAMLWISTLIDADEAGDLERGREAMTALAAPRYAEVEMIRVAKMYDPNRPTAPGRSVPDFRLKSPDGKTEYSAETLRGTTYVLDFWATWCGPCIAEMPRLHAAYATLNGKTAVERRAYKAIAKPELQILSISLDHDAKIVEKYRADQWPMPWAHAVPDVATHKQLSAAFGIVGIPMMVLVGPDGTILASSPRLDGSNLDALAREHL